MNARATEAARGEIWRIRRVLTEWANASERIRELTIETGRYEEASKECYDTLLRKPADGTRSGGGKARDMAETLERAEGLAREYARAISRNHKETERLFKLKEAADKAVWALPAHLGQVISLRYKQRLKWELAALRLRAAERTARRWELKALRILAKNEGLAGFSRDAGARSPR
jgi:hypothetical protein